jgi:hypothetical protein
MATVDKLVVKIEADLADLKRKLSSAQSQTKRTTQSMGRSFDGLKKNLGGLSSTIFSLKGAIVGLGVGAGVKSLINVGNEVESLQIRFETLFGSADEGQKAFETMANFASKVPFSLQQIQAGSGSLLAVADDAEELGELLKMTGTIAAATGLDFRTASEQIQRSLSAGIGAADLFRDRGVTAMLGFKAGTQVSVEETREALERFAKDNDGITDRLAGTFSGTLSMIGDAVFTFQRTINDAGFFSSLTAHFKNLQTTMEQNKEQIAEFAKSLSSTLIGAMSALKTVVVIVAKNFDLLVIAVKAYIALRLGALLGSIIQGFIALKGALVGATIAQGSFNAVAKLNPYTAIGTVAVATLGLVASTYKKVAETIKRSEGRLEELNQTTANHNKFLSDLISKQRKANREYEKYQSTIGASNDAVQELIDAQIDEQAKLKLSAFELAQYNLAKEHDITLSTEKLALLKKEIEATAELNKQLKIEQDIINKNAGEANKAFSGLSKSTDPEKKGLLGVPDNERDNPLRKFGVGGPVANNETQEEIALLEQLGIRTADFTDQQILLKQALDGNRISTDEYKEALAQLDIKALESTKHGAILMEGLGKVADGLSTSIANSLMGMGEGMKSFKDTMKSAVRDIIAQFIKMQIQAAITKAAMSFMGGGGGGSIASFFGGKAGGGFVQSNKPVLVGERGPELFVPSTAGNVMTNNRSRQASGGSGTVNQTLNFDVGVAQTVRSEILSLMPTIKQESITAMVDAKERGGRVADVFK